MAGFFEFQAIGKIGYLDLEDGICALAVLVKRDAKGAVRAIRVSPMLHDSNISSLSLVDNLESKKHAV